MSLKSLLCTVLLVGGVGVGTGAYQATWGARSMDRDCCTFGASVKPCCAERQCTAAETVTRSCCPDGPCCPDGACCQDGDEAAAGPDGHVCPLTGETLPCPQCCPLNKGE